MKTQLLFLSSILFSFSISAQIDFEAHVAVDDTGGTNGANSVCTVDLDGDGDLDIVSSSVNDTKLAWYKNNNGDFGPQIIISESITQINQVIAADIDGDGDFDLISSAYNNGVIWFENLDGQGNFADPEAVSPENISANRILAKDIDGDGDMDIVVNKGLGSSIAWYENIDGAGTFEIEHTIAPNGSYFYSIDAKDIDGDGDMDVVGPSFLEDDISWFENLDGLGNFGPKQIISSDVSRPHGVTIADIDGDDDMDVIATSSSDNKIVWFENLNGEGSFGIQRFISSNVQRPDNVYIADLDNDGNMDVVCDTHNSSKINWFRNDGLGNFGTIQLIEDEARIIGDIELGDLDNDGAVDILSASYLDDKIAYYMNTNGLGDFGPQQIVVEINGINGPYNVFSIDMDGDGDKDILSTASNGNKIAWLENVNGQGNFSGPKTISLQLVYPVTINAADIDGDGDMDVVSESLEDHIVGWFENIDGQGTLFTSHLFDPLFSSPRVTYPMDFDNDGDIDIVSGGIGVFWYENIDGQGNFGSAQIIEGTDNYSVESITAADIDGDSYLDLVFGHEYENILFWYKNNGEGNYGPQEVVATSISFSSIITVDLDNDGDQDILASTGGSSSAIWIENIDGQGTFGPKRLVNNNSNGSSKVYAKDLDLDGDMDVLTASNTSIYCYKNLGSGNFGSEEIISSQVNSTFCVYADDFNEDGKIDVLASSFSNDEIIWFENKITLGIEEIQPALFTIYPNPTNGLLHIQSKTSIAEITIFNNPGQLLLASKGKNQIDISTLSEGIYFVKIKDENGQTETKKVLKK